MSEGAAGRSYLIDLEKAYLSFARAYCGLVCNLGPTNPAVYVLVISEAMMTAIGELTDSNETCMRVTVIPVPESF
jgi:hypothetical protein